MNGWRASWAVLNVWLFLSVAGVAMGQGAGATGLTTAQLQQLYKSDWEGRLDTVVQAMSQDIYSADPFVQSHSALHPDGKLAALTVSREEETGQRWPIIILNRHTLDVELVFDNVRGYQLGRFGWSPSGRYLMVLAHDRQLSGPPGTLWLIDPVQRQAFVVDRGIWSYTVGPKESSLVYERCQDPDQPLGAREIACCQLSRFLGIVRDEPVPPGVDPKQIGNHARAQSIKTVFQLPYPKLQLDGFKSWSASGKTLHMSLYRYKPGMTHPVRERYALHVPAGRMQKLTR